MSELASESASGPVRLGMVDAPAQPPPSDALAELYRGFERGARCGSTE